MLNKIDRFVGDNYFLSNFYPVQVWFEGMGYPSAEHAYVAAKTNDMTIRRVIQRMTDAASVKKYGRNLRLRPDWPTYRLVAMENIVRAKFTLNPYLAQELIETGDAELIEGNWWNDTFWGTCNDYGENHLGKILMKIREEINVSNSHNRQVPE